MKKKLNFNFAANSVLSFTHIDREGYLSRVKNGDLTFWKSAMLLFVSTLIVTEQHYLDIMFVSCFCHWMWQVSSQ